MNFSDEIWSVNFQGDPTFFGGMRPLSRTFFYQVQYFAHFLSAVNQESGFWKFVRSSACREYQRPDPVLMPRHGIFPESLFQPVNRKFRIFFQIRKKQGSTENPEPFPADLFRFELLRLFIWKRASRKKSNLFWGVRSFDHRAYLKREWLLIMHDSLREL